MSDLTSCKCPKCGARLTAVRADHHLTGHEKLACPTHGVIGHLGDDRRRVYGRHKEHVDDDED